MATLTAGKLRQLFLPMASSRLHGLSMGGFVLLSLIYDNSVVHQLVSSGGRIWSSIHSLPWLLGYLVMAMAGGLSGLDMALLRRRGLQRHAMLSLALMLVILAPAVVLVNPALSGEFQRLQGLNVLGIAAFASGLVMLMPILSPNRLQVLNGGQRRPNETALHRSDDPIKEKISDLLGYLVSGLMGALLMLITGIALLSPIHTFEQVFERYPMLPAYLGMTFVNGSMCVALAAFAATLRDRRLISEATEKFLMFAPVFSFLISLVVIPLIHPSMDWILPANRELIMASLRQLSP
jgi:hypothetical protein